MNTLPISWKRDIMESKRVALTITFAASAIALNAVKIPTIFYPGTAFQFVQIPMTVAFLLFGVEIGVFVGVLNLLGALVLFPLGAAGLIAYPMDFVSLAITFAGLFVAIKFIRRKDESETSRSGKKLLISYTAFATAFRGIIMALIDYAVVFHVLLPAVGINRPEAFIIGLVPAFVAYNAIVALYTVPIAYIIATNVGSYLKTEPRLLKYAT